jgi:hypothetical protein
MGIGTTSNRSGEAFVAAVAGESGRLAELVAKNAPGSRGEPVNLSGSDPPALQAFWRAVGWNDQWPRRFRLHHPDADRSARELPQLLQQLAGESPGSPALAPGGLPKACRLADVDRDGIGFVLTNEDDPQRRDDPPMAVVIFDTGETSPVPTSYLSWCADELIAIAFSDWFQEFVAPAEIPASAAEPPFRTLSPTTRILAPDVWLLPADGYAPPTADRSVAFASPENFTAFFKRPPRRQRR